MRVHFSPVDQGDLQGSNNINGSWIMRCRRKGPRKTVFDRPKVKSYW